MENLNIIILVVSFIATIVCINWIKKRKSQSKVFEVLLKKGYEDLQKSDTVKGKRARLNKMENALKQFKKALEIFPKKEIKDKIASCEEKVERLRSQLRKDF